jgi:hypothetical protein
MAKMASKGTSQMTLRKNLEWNEVDSTYSLGIGKYCKEWLFPCFKFYMRHGWIIPSLGRGCLG